MAPGDCDLFLTEVEGWRQEVEVDSEEKLIML